MRACVHTCHSTHARKPKTCSLQGRYAAAVRQAVLPPPITRQSIPCCPSTSSTHTQYTHGESIHSANLLHRRGGGGVENLSAVSARCVCRAVSAATTPVAVAPPITLFSPAWFTSGATGQRLALGLRERNTLRPGFSRSKLGVERRIVEVLGALGDLVLRLDAQLADRDLSREEGSREEGSREGGGVT